MSVDGFPADADGDVLRRLKKHGFDFSQRHDVDFSVEFEAWPPSAEAVARLEENYPSVLVGEEEVVVQVRDFVTYDFVVRTQSLLSGMMRTFGGVCETWGVWEHSPKTP